VKKRYERHVFAVYDVEVEQLLKIDCRRAIQLLLSID
jgi:hypothetical protein